MRIVTDSKTVADPKDPDRCNVFALFKLFATEAQREEMTARYRGGGLGYGVVKKQLFDMFDAHFAPLRRRRAELQKNMDHVQAVLKQGAARARAVARDTLRRARQAVGLE